MKKSMLVALGLSAVLFTTAWAESPSKKANKTLKTEIDKLSYTIGADLGQNFKQQQIDISRSVFIQGLTDGLEGKTLLLTKEQMEETLKTFQQKILAKRAEQFKEVADKNKQKGETFLSKNKSKQGVVTTDSGLQYKIIEQGKGNQPASKDLVTVEYTGKLIDGTVFDSTSKTGKPVTFSVDEVIPGWTEALKLMKEGAKWEVYVPAQLAYGERGMGGPIGPNEMLIFDIHLISVKKPEQVKKSDS